MMIKDLKQLGTFFKRVTVKLLSSFPELLPAGHGGRSRKTVGGNQRRGGPSARYLLGKWRSTVKSLICQQNPRQVFKDQELHDEAQG